MAKDLKGFIDRDNAKHEIMSIQDVEEILSKKSDLKPFVLHVFGSGPYRFIEETDDQTEKDAFAESMEPLAPGKQYLCVVPYGNGITEYGWLSITVNQTTGYTTFSVITGLRKYSGSFNDTGTHTVTDGMFTITELPISTESHKHVSIGDSNTSVAAQNGAVMLAGETVNFDIGEDEVTLDAANLANFSRALTTPSSTPENNANKLITSKAVYEALLNKQNGIMQYILTKTQDGFEWSNDQGDGEEVIGNLINAPGSNMYTPCIIIVDDDGSEHCFMGTILWTKTTDDTTVPGPDDTRLLRETYNVTIYVANTKLVTTVLHDYYAHAHDEYSYGSITATTITPIF